MDDTLGRLWGESTALAAVLLVTGWRLIGLHHVRHLFAHHGYVLVRIWGATVTMVVMEDPLTGVAIGLAPAVIQVAPHLRRKFVLERREQDDEIRLGLRGAATCRDVPALLDTLEGLPEGRGVRLVGEDLRYMDHTSAETISGWVRRETRTGRRVEINPPRAERHPGLERIFARLSAETA
jgi:MFS superfamily sulfate permease-like transporter